MDVLITFDLENANSQDYDRAYAILENVFDLKPISPQKSVRLPESTVMGTIIGPVSNRDTAEIRDLVYALLVTQKLKPSAIAVCKVSDWAVATYEPASLETRLRSALRDLRLTSLS